MRLSEKLKEIVEKFSKKLSIDERFTTFESLREFAEEKSIEFQRLSLEALEDYELAKKSKKIRLAHEKSDYWLFVGVGCFCTLVRSYLFVDESDQEQLSIISGLAGSLSSQLSIFTDALDDDELWETCSDTITFLLIVRDCFNYDVEE